MHDATVGEARVAFDGVRPSGIESRGEYADDSPSIVFDDERQVLEALAVVSQKPAFMEEGAVPRLGR